MSRISRNFDEVRVRKCFSVECGLKLSNARKRGSASHLDVQFSCQQNRNKTFEAKVIQNVILKKDVSEIPESNYDFVALFQLILVFHESLLEGEVFLSLFHQLCCWRKTESVRASAGNFEKAS